MKKERMNKILTVVLIVLIAITAVLSIQKRLSDLWIFIASPIMVLICIVILIIQISLRNSKTK